MCHGWPNCSAVLVRRIWDACKLGPWVQQGIRHSPVPNSFMLRVRKQTHSMQHTMKYASVGVSPRQWVRAQGELKSSAWGVSVDTEKASGRAGANGEWQDSGRIERKKKNRDSGETDESCHSPTSLLPCYCSAGTFPWGCRKGLEGSNNASDQHWSTTLLAIFASKKLLRPPRPHILL